MNGYFGPMVPMVDPNAIAANTMQEMAQKLEHLKQNNRQQQNQVSKPFIYPMPIGNLEELKAMRCFDDIPNVGFMLDKGNIYVKYPSGDIEYYARKEVIKAEVPQSTDDKIKEMADQMNEIKALLANLTQGGIANASKHESTSNAKWDDGTNAEPDGATDARTDG